MTKTFNLSIDSELLMAVDSFAKETRRSRSEIIRWALEEFLYTHYPNPPIYMHKRFQKEGDTSSIIPQSSKGIVS